MSHTPGPWRVEMQAEEDAAWADKWPTIISDGYTVVGTEGLYGDIDTDAANARLIAAAPELLEALQHILLRGVRKDFGSVITYEILPECEEFARAAIAKATNA